jgi:hypothetical protein
MRTLDNCKLVQRLGRPRQYDGRCEGFQRGETDDEPCETCKSCKLHHINQEEAALHDTGRDTAARKEGT